MSTYAHKMIADLCVDMASAVFDEAMSADNSIYRSVREAHPGKSTEQLRRLFCRRMAPRLVGDARNVLAQLLEKDSLSIADKDRIYDALLKDASFRSARTRQERRLFTH